jgi:NNP family nitrate/nitrite transporter-like MFS transporter
LPVQIALHYICSLQIPVEGEQFINMLKSTINGLRAGHWPSLFGAWLHFEVSFVVWLSIGALGVAISADFSLSATQKGFLVAVPLLGGAILRVIVGPMADHWGAKRVGLYLSSLQVLALFLGWRWGMNFCAMLGIGLLLGCAGASFAIALPIASEAYPPTHQGLAMGVAAIGNSGVLIATLFAPRLAQLFGWQNTFGVMIIPVLLTAVIFWLIVKPSAPKKGGFQDSASSIVKNAIRQKFLYWLCFLYSLTFGGFVGLSSFFPIFLHDQYHIDMITAGSMTALCGLAGSLARPIGGHLADRIGGTVLLQMIFPMIGIFGVGLSQLLEPLWAFPMMVVILLLLGFGNGVVFQVVSLRFRSMMGTASGLIGAAGGLGGFLFPACFGFLKDATGTFASGFWVLVLISATAGLSVMVVQRAIRPSVQPVE